MRTRLCKSSTRSRVQRAIRAMPLAVAATTKAAKAKRGAKGSSGRGWTSGVCGVSGVSGASAVGEKVAAELKPADAVLYESLKAWRSEAAREGNVPALVMLHDSVLREIAAARPKNKAALAAISGIGESKLLRCWGRDFADCLRRVGRICRYARLQRNRLEGNEQLFCKSPVYYGLNP